MNLLTKSLKALQYLGLRKLWFYTIYRVCLKTGHYRRATPSQFDDFNGSPSLDPYATYPSPSREQKEHALSRAEEILQGRYRPFSGELMELNLQ
ncbi:MAG: hypothetical protein ACOCYU_06700, partial [Brevefilum sp.]